MNSVDRKIAIGGIVLIIILACVACVLLSMDRKDSPVKVVKEVERVELNEISKEVDVQKDSAINSAAPSVSKVSNDIHKTQDEKTDVDNLADEFYSKKRLRQIRNTDNQMKELYDYWIQGREEAVADLIRLERVRNITNELQGSNDFYYYGEVNSGKLPSGKGLAIYADNTYYFGDWSNGMREGKGTWLQIFPDGEQKVGNFEGVTEHFYTGDFKADMPNGAGQENYVYNPEKIVGSDNYSNVIGGFKNGYYNSQLIIYTIDENSRRYEWTATAHEGKFDICEENKISTTGKKPVWFKGDDNEHSTDESDNGYYWMADSENSGFGVYGLKK